MFKWFVDIDWCFCQLSRPKTTCVQTEMRRSSVWVSHELQGCMHGTRQSSRISPTWAVSVYSATFHFVSWAFSLPLFLSPFLTLRYSIQDHFSYCLFPLAITRRKIETFGEEEASFEVSSQCKQILQAFKALLCLWRKHKMLPRILSLIWTQKYSNIL